jgi:hypothetical protein
MAAASPPRDHHYIPRFYQRQWAGEDGRIERYTRVATGDVHRSRVTPAAVGYQRDLYRHPRTDMDEQSAQALEWAVLARIDDAAAKALEALLSNAAALQNDTVRRDWTIFLRSMLLRTPYQMAGTLASLEHIWREADGGVNETYAKAWKPGMPVTATDFLEMLNPNAAGDGSRSNDPPHYEAPLAYIRLLHGGPSPTAL